MGFILSGAVSLVLIAARRLTLQSTISFGPFTLAGPCWPPWLAPGSRPRRHQHTGGTDLDITDCGAHSAPRKPGFVSQMCNSNYQLPTAHR